MREISRRTKVDTTSLPQAVQQNPALIQPLIQQIAGANPQLAQLIAQNPEALLQLLGAGDDEEGDMGEMGGEVMQVDLTAEEAAAVERVSSAFTYITFMILLSL